MSPTWWAASGARERGRIVEGIEGNRERGFFETMNNDMLWVTEGFVLDEAANVIATSYVDLRSPGARTAIRTLMKGCRREHALEDAEKILVSPVGRFRTEGENLIQDEQEGLAIVETEVVEPETQTEILLRRRLADVEEAVELLDSSLRVKHRCESRRVRRSRGRLAFGREWWIYSTAIKPETEEEWAKWKAALDPAYDHVSEVGQPAKFAEALGRMVTEQLGPQGTDGWIRGSIGDGGGSMARTKHPTQWVVHGPVVYSDRLYDTLTRDADDAARIAASMFTKRKMYAPQREYRFAILRDGAVAEEVLLNISGMMRDALQPGMSALVRPAPEPTGTTSDPDTSSSRTGRTQAELRERQAMVKRRVARRETMRSETRAADGVVSSSSEGTEWESVHETTVTGDTSAVEQVRDAAEAIGGRADGNNPVVAEQPMPPDSSRAETENEDAIREIAFGKADSETEVEPGVADALFGSGHNGGSFEEAFTKMLDDPTSPTAASSEPWATSKLSRAEVLDICGWMTTLAHKVTQVSIEHREAASSACWQAIQYIRNIYVRLGAIVKTVSIERQRFVVLELKTSDESKATGRIVVAPSGARAYAFKEPNNERVGSSKGTVSHSEGELGTVFFPLGHLDKFESFGWPPKDD